MYYRLLREIISLIRWCYQYDLQRLKYEVLNLPMSAEEKELKVFEAFNVCPKWLKAKRLEEELIRSGH